ncbi:MAG: hypothetical protein U0175_33015 [Caldilineaceae bacterium]
MYKVMISYNMQPGKEQECQDTLANKVAPGLARLGFRFSDVWFTIYGNSPQILGGGVVKDMDEARRIFLSDAWSELKEQMERVTNDLQVKLVVAREEESQD